jgi:plastocyanin
MDVPVGDRQPQGFGWRRLQLLASIAVLMSLLVTMLIHPPTGNYQITPDLLAKPAGLSHSDAATVLLDIAEDPTLARMAFNIAGGNDRFDAPTSVHGQKREALMKTLNGDPVSAPKGLQQWRLVLVLAALAQILLNVGVMLISGEVVPPLIAVSVLLAVGLLVLRGRPRGGAATVGIVSVLHLATSGPFLAEGLVHPESFWDFWLGWSTVLAAALAVPAAVAVWRQKHSRSMRARGVAMAAGGLIVALGVAGGVATMAYENDTAQEGDLALLAHNVEFQPAALAAEAGELTVFVENRDSLRHTFSIDELDVDLEIPGDKAVRIEFTARPGIYEFYCAVPGHEDMKGELVVE